MSVRSACAKLMAEGNSTREELEQRRMMNAWVWEYILMECKDFRLPELLVEQLPLPETFCAKKIMLFKLLYFDEAKEDCLDRDLDALEGLESLYREEWKVELSKSRRELLDLVQRLQVLFRAELAVKHLRQDEPEAFAKALEDYWGEIVQDTEAVAVDDPSIEEFRRQVRTDLWAVKARPKMLKFVLEEYSRETLQEQVKRFLELARAELGPPFLEKAAQDVLQGRYVPEKRASEETSFEKKKSNKRIRKTLLPSLDGENGASSDAEAENPHLEKALNALKESQSNLREHVKDPLPGALKVAKELKRTASETNRSAEKQQTVDMPKQHTGANSIYDRQPSARTLEWTSDDELEETRDSPSASRGVHLPNNAAGKAKLSPLRKNDVKPESSKSRRKKNRWTHAEEQALREGVVKYGKGRWKAILTDNLKVFANRTEVDLKDKWRNIEKNEGITR